MLAVVASRFDPEATALVARWAEYGAALITCEDLSAPGWRHYLNDKFSSKAVLNGAVVPVFKIQGVLVRRPKIFEEELTYVAAADREYIAAEMNAFLLSWLAALTCPVLNPPTTTCLSGPLWRPQQWVHTAASIGIRVQPLQLCVPAGLKPTDNGPTANPLEVATVTVIDDHCFGAPHKVICDQARRLATAAGVRFLSVAFDVAADPPVFQGADIFPKLTDRLVTDALLDALQSQTLRTAFKAEAGR